MSDKTDPKNKIILELNTEIKHWERLFNSSETPMMILDSNFEIMKANTAMLAFLDKPLDEVIGKACHKVVLETRMPIESCPLEKMKATKKREEVELYFPKKDKYIIVSVDPSLDEKGDIFQVIHSLRDITYLKKAQNQLLLSENRFRQVTENAQEWIWEVDAQGLYIFSSQAVENMLGYSQEEIVGKKYFYDLFHPEAKDGQKKEAFEIFAQKNKFRYFLNMNMHKNGRTVWVMTSGTPILDSNGALLGIEALIAISPLRKISRSP